jgi:hypothetical protein
MEQLGADQSLGAIFALSTAIAIILFLVVLLVAIYGYFQRRLRAVIADAQDVSELAAARDRYISEIEQARAWQGEAREELLKMDAEREAQERLRLELNQAELAAGEAEQKADEARKEALELQHAVTALSDDRDRLKTEIEGASESATAAQTELRRLEDARELAAQSAREAEEQARNLAAEAQARQEEMNLRAAELRETEERRTRLDSEIRNLEIRQESMQGEVARLTSELSEAQAQLSRVQTEVEPIREGVRERMRLDAEVNELRSAVSELEQQKNELDEAQGLRIAGARYSDLFDIEPPCLADRVFANGSLGRISEEQALAHVEQHLAAQGLVFSTRVLHAFHTCLKVADISPITVLAGISGTGKSELPLRYAEAMGMHSLPIAVQPSWSSPQDLFGFYNYLEKRYKATELARTLVRMDPYNFSDGDDPAFEAVRRGSRADRVLLVLIDEMNLARVEYYFSEFLSKLEARRAVIDPSVEKKRSPAEIEIEGAQRATRDGRPASSGIRLWVGNNVLFSGTMNEDESTQTLSDKVLDRANVLRFGKPPAGGKKLGGEARRDDFIRDRYLSVDTWESWARSVPQDSRWRRNVDDWTERLNDALSLIGRPFGWRVKEAIHAYVANYPGVEGGTVYKTAMADQVEQKVLPKLRGIDVTQQQSTEALNVVESVLEDLGDEVLLNAVKDCHQDATYGTFNWRGVTRD